MKSKLLVGLLVIGSFALGLNASSLSQEVKAILRKDVIVTVDDKFLSLAGSEPLVYNGTTYLPIRKIGEAVNKEVQWNQKTNTIKLVKPGLGDKVAVDVNQTYAKRTSIPKYTFGRDIATIHEGLALSFKAEIETKGKQKFECVMYNISDKELTFTASDLSPGANKGRFYNIVIPVGESAKIELDVSGMTKIELWNQINYASGFVSMVDAYLQ